jgi:hypothetical protein
MFRKIDWSWNSFFFGGREGWSWDAPGALGPPWGFHRGVEANPMWNPWQPCHGWVSSSRYLEAFSIPANIHHHTSWRFGDYLLTLCGDNCFSHFSLHSSAKFVGSAAWKGASSSRPHCTPAIRGQLVLPHVVWRLSEFSGETIKGNMLVSSSL